MKHDGPVCAVNEQVLMLSLMTSKNTVYICSARNMIILKKTTVNSIIFYFYDSPGLGSQVTTIIYHEFRWFVSPG